MKLTKNTVPAILIFSLIILLVGCNKENKSINLNASQTTSVNIIKASNTITAKVSFNVMDSKLQPIQGVKIMIINGEGEVIDSITSDDKGKAEKKLTVPIDKRYFWADPNDLGTRGTVTAIAFKEGYRETVLFEVPVSEGDTVQPFYMSPIIPGERNEPDVQLGNNHHLEILSLVDKYAQYLKKTH
ncbi:hypothetical protein Desaci_2089 [Desulfosporosinus acidiphilus SJ4]|uniref:Lipoprotein n=1 Tax=Desulfosporosinus acidiphilus (strain DSM 22704 / JCM 16185 / SJ4) TaxID=646529 RepID=I4D5I6_DESAJ|nr:carboxypeptidase-like regulatory domain-containing protein [Desulfosporosinus acidiphilus]AFM41060.1 hypothetical protein Desaci_2089 [Desulfosporosinus acidiphilus SJ4]